MLGPKVGAPSFDQAAKSTAMLPEERLASEVPSTGE
jgi:hypothetical protein